MAERTGAGTGGGPATRSRLPFRRKMDLLVVLPTLAMAALMTPVAVHEAGVARQWNTAVDFLSSTKSVSQLIQDLSLERDKAQAAMSGDPEKARAYNDAIVVTDSQVTEVSQAFGRRATPTLTAALAAVSDLSYVRELPTREGMSQNYLVQAHVQELVDKVYGAIDAQLVQALDFGGHSAAGGPASSLEAELALLYSGDMAESQREASLTAFASAPTEYNSASQYNTATRMDQVAQTDLGFVLQFPAPADQAMISAVLGAPEYQLFRAYQAKADTLFGSAFQDQRGVVGPPKNLQDIQTLADRTALTAAFETASNQRAVAEARITDRIISLSKSNARRAELTVAVMIGVGVLAAAALMALSALIRRSVVRPVLALTGAATRVARAAAADLERVTDEDLGAGGDPPEFEAIPVPTDDELGDLAQAFNKVQETALRMLERQVTIRRNTAEMFGNVGHRIHNLTGRQLAIIDQVERTETDPVLLDRLYRIDHLAVRLQRGADSLILLSGEREANLSGAPMRLTDVVRSAVGRVEGYQRVVLIAEDDAMVAPSAVGDLTLMVAELVENAVSFSPASQRVEIAVGLSARGFVIEVVDRGMGMSPEQLAQENARLVRRERLDLAPTRVLGLFVVGRLSVRTGAAVELSATPGGGTTARVYVPGFLLAGPVADGSGPRALRGDAAEAAATGTPAVTAAPGAPGVPALPAASGHAALAPARPQGGGTGPDGWPSSGVAPAGPDGLPRRIPGRMQPVAESFGGQAAGAGQTAGAAANQGTGYGADYAGAVYADDQTFAASQGQAAADSGAASVYGQAAAGQAAANGVAASAYGQAPAGQTAVNGVAAANGVAASAYGQETSGQASANGVAASAYGQAPAGQAATNGAAASSYAQPPAAGHPGYDQAARHSAYPGDPAQPTQPSDRPAQPSFQPHPAQAAQASAAQAPATHPAPPSDGRTPPHLDGSALRVSGLDAIALPVPSQGDRGRYSLGPLAPVSPDAPGRRRAREAGGELPHQPVPEPRRDSEHLPARLSPVVPPTSAAPPSEASPLVHPHLPEPQGAPSAPAPAAPARPAPAGPAAAQSATAPQPADNALPRRVRKTPAQPDWPTAPLSAVDGPAQPQDPAAVRDALLEYEAGVERALQDSAHDMPARRQPARHAGPAPERDGEDQ